MLRSLAVFIAVLCLSGPSTATDVTAANTAAEKFHSTFQDVPARSPEFLASLGISAPQASAAQQGCCKICTRGKACGNTCISQDKVCHVGPGCACDG